MKVFLDANVLFPTVLRELLIGWAAAGGFAPLWSERVLSEWAHAAAKRGPVEGEIARGEIALLRATWPAALVPPDPALEATLSLPDPDDTHVLAAAITGEAAAILTENARDFPPRALARHGLMRLGADAFLVDAATEPGFAAVLSTVQARAEAAAGAPQPLRPLLKRARLPRLAKAVG